MEKHEIQKAYQLAIRGDDGAWLSVEYNTFEECVLAEKTNEWVITHKVSDDSYYSIKVAYHKILAGRWQLQ